MATTIHMTVFGTEDQAHRSADRAVDQIRTATGRPVVQGPTTARPVVDGE